jgi:hypothetical protein
MFTFEGGGAVIYSVMSATPVANGKPAALADLLIGIMLTRTSPGISKSWE